MCYNVSVIPNEMKCSGQMCGFHGSSVRVLCLLLLLPLASGGFDQGVGWLETEIEDNPNVAKVRWLPEFIPGSEINPFTWPEGAPIWGSQRIVDWSGGALSEASVRHLAALASLGISDTYPDPIRGNISLLETMERQHGALSWRPNEGALVSWHIWGLRAAGVPEDDPMMLEAEQWLTDMQQEDGSVPCNSSFGRPNVDCTGWALVALGGRNETFHDAGAAFLLSHQHENGGFGIHDINLQATIWAATALGMGPDSEAGQFIQSLQAPDGKFHCTSLEVGCNHSWATADALSYLQGNHPLKHREPPTIYGASGVQAGKMSFSASEEVTWHVNGEQFRGVELELSLHESTTIYAHGDGWARFHVEVLPRQDAPTVPLLFAVGALGWAAYRRK